MSGIGWRLRTGLETLRDLFYPPHCVGCGGAIAEKWFCAKCAEDVTPVEAPRCETCSEPFSGEIGGEFVCTNCRGRAFHFTHAVGVMRSRGVVRELIHRFKYNGEVWLAEPLEEFLEQGLADERLAGEKIDAIVPVPLHSLRKREREFNQAEILGKSLSRRNKIAYSEALERTRYTTTQTRMDREGRMQNLRDAFRLRQNAGVQGKQLLLVDDVFTTGSTLDECARVLLKGGAKSVRALTVARG